MNKISNKMVLSYDVNGTLQEALKVAVDMESETGMGPRAIRDEATGEEYQYVSISAQMVVENMMDIESYKEMNRNDKDE